MPIDISNKEQLDIPLTGTQMNDAIVQAYNSKDAIANIEGMSAIASEIDSAIVKVSSTENVFGVVRQDTIGSGWYFINDAQHAPLGFNLATVVPLITDTTLVLPFDKTYSKIGAVLAVSDESYSRDGLLIGLSIINTEIRATFYANLGFKLNLGDLTVTERTGFFPYTVTKSGDSEYTIEIGYECEEANITIDRALQGYTIDVTQRTSTKVSFRVYKDSIRQDNALFNVYIRRGLSRVFPYYLHGNLSNVWIHGSMYN